MAGNLVSIMNVSKGRGGCNPETKNRKPFHLSLQKKRMTKCQACDTILPEKVKICPFCGESIKVKSVDRRILKRESTIQTTLKEETPMVDRYIKYLCIYHSADMDGKMSAAMIHRTFKATCEGYNYNRPVNVAKYIEDYPNLEKVFVVDYSITKDEIKAFLEANVSIVWCDHHKTVIDKFFEMDFSKGCNSFEDEFIINHMYHYNDTTTFETFISLDYSGCELTYIYIALKTNVNDYSVDNYSISLLEDGRFKINNPVVYLLGRYDVWDKSIGNEKWKDALNLQTYFYNQSSLPHSDVYAWVLNTKDPESFYKKFAKALVEGAELNKYRTKINSSRAKTYSFTIKWEGFTFLAMNDSGNSLLVDSVFDPSIHDAIMYFIFDPKSVKWKFSLFGSDKSDKDIDLSKIALKYGGGGHKKACGFLLKELPFSFKAII